MPGLPALDSSLSWYTLPGEKWASVGHTCVTQLVERTERLRKLQKGWETQNSALKTRVSEEEKLRDMR